MEEKMRHDLYITVCSYDFGEEDDRRKPPQLILPFRVDPDSRRAWRELLQQKGRKIDLRSGSLTIILRVGSSKSELKDQMAKTTYVLVTNHDLGDQKLAALLANYGLIYQVD